jgi:hypothetical protein
VGITIRSQDVPDDLYRTLESRAALGGLVLSDYLLNELRHMTERPTPQEFRARLGSRAESTLATAPAEAIREERDRA